MDQVPETAANGVAEIIHVEEADLVEEPAKPQELSVTTEDRLQAENLALRFQLTSMQKGAYVQSAQQQIEVFDGKLRDLKQSIAEFQQHLSITYGIDFTKQQIEAGTGRIVPAPGVS